MSATIEERLSALELIIHGGPDPITGDEVDGLIYKVEDLAAEFGEDGRVTMIEEDLYGEPPLSEREKGLLDVVVGLARRIEALESRL